MKTNALLNEKIYQKIIHINYKHQINHFLKVMHRFLSGSEMGYHLVIL